MLDGSSLALLTSILFSAALVGSALLGWLADLKRVGASTSARETTRRGFSRGSPRGATGSATQSAVDERRARWRSQFQSTQGRSGQEQEERIREAYFSKERKAREERERRRRQQARQRTRQSAGQSAGPSASGGHAHAGAGPRPAGSPEARHRATLELTGPVTPSSLRSAYRRLIAAYHPDRVATLGVKLQKLAEEETKRINEAYAYFRRTLKG